MGRLSKINPDTWASDERNLGYDKNKSKKQKKSETIQKVKDPQKEKILESNSSPNPNMDAKICEIQKEAIPPYIKTALGAILPLYYVNRVQQGARGIATLIKMVADYFQIPLSETK